MKNLAKSKFIEIALNNTLVFMGSRKSIELKGLENFLSNEITNETLNKVSSVKNRHRILQNKTLSSLKFHKGDFSESSYLDISGKDRTCYLLETKKANYLIVHHYSFSTIMGKYVNTTYYKVGTDII